MAFDPRGLNWAALAGLASGNTVGEQLGNANAIMAQQTEKARELTTENQTRAWLSKTFPGQNFDGLQGQALNLAFADALRQRAEAQQPKFIGVGNGYLYDQNTKQYIAPPEGYNTSQTQSDLGLNPQYGVDAQGNPVLIQMSKDGKSVQSQLPEGVKLSKEPIKLDAGTHFVLLDPITRQPVGTVPKDVSGAKEQEKLGTELGAIKAALPSARLTAKNVSTQIAALKTDPGLPAAVGPIDSRFPTFSSTTAAAEARIRQLEGQAFLQAREMLRGGGQITDYEGQRAENAIARLSTAQSEEDFKAALDDFNSAVQDGLAKLEAAAAGRDYNPSQAQQPNTSVDSLVEKYRTK